MPHSKRVLLFAHDTEPSGAPKVTLDVARCLHAHGHQVVIVFPMLGGMQAMADKEGIKTLVIKNPAESFASASIGRKLGLLYYRAQAFLVALSMGLDRPVFWIGSTVLPEMALAGKLSGCRVIVHVHEDIPVTPKNRLRIWLLKYCAKKLVFVGELISKPFGNLQPDQKMVIPNRIPEHFFQYTGSRPLPKQRIIFASGFLSHRKGFDLLIHALAEIRNSLPDTRLQIAGTDPDPEERELKKLQQLAKENGVEQEVEFLGYRDDIPELLRQSSVFVLSSRNEAMPLSLVEALAAGVPVVATDVGSVREIVKDGETGLLVRSESIEELSRGIIEVLQDEILATKMALNAQQAVRVRFDSEKITDAYNHLLTGN